MIVSAPVLGEAWEQMRERQDWQKKKLVKKKGSYSHVADELDPWMLWSMDEMHPRLASSSYKEIMRRLCSNKTLFILALEQHLVVLIV